MVCWTNWHNANVWLRSEGNVNHKGDTVAKTGREFEIIQQYFRQGFLPGRDVSVDIGDDASVICQSYFQGYDWVQSIDTQVADIHFPSNAPADRIACRALRCAVSDLIAMGATPHSFHLAITLPEANAEWLKAFSRGLSATAKQFKIALIGGDTTRGEALIITLAVQGRVPAGKAITRSGARAEDDVWISGSVGAAACALEKVLRDPSCKSVEADAYYYPSIDTVLGQSLIGTATACIDISDGLIQDALHIAQNSNLSMVLLSERIPTHKSIDDENWLLCLTGGDDYRLLFTAPHGERPNLDKIPAIRRIGYMIEDKPDVIILKDHQPMSLDIKETGYQHF